jgi:hypothetical protein
VRSSRKSSRRRPRCGTRSGGSSES